MMYIPSETYQERQCYLCGKKFYALPEYAYKCYLGRQHVEYFCSWSHLQRTRREYEANESRSGRSATRRARAIEMIRQGATVSEVAAQMGLKENTVRYYWTMREDGE